MKLISTVIMCHECEMPYYKAFWEPMWLARIAVKDTHAEWHNMAMNPETTPLAKGWREWERNRIIKLLEDELPHYASSRSVKRIIELIQDK